MLNVKCQSIVSFHIKGQMLIEEKQRSAAEKSIKGKVLRGLQPPWYKRVIFQADKNIVTRSDKNNLSGSDKTTMRTRLLQHSISEPQPHPAQKYPF